MSQASPYFFATVNILLVPSYVNGDKRECQKTCLLCPFPSLQLQYVCLHTKNVLIASHFAIKMPKFDIEVKKQTYRSLFLTQTIRDRASTRSLSVTYFCGTGRLPDRGHLLFAQDWPP
jgi:hypothetical protein